VQKNLLKEASILVKKEMGVEEGEGEGKGKGRGIKGTA
jgi:hypothetical protein